MTVNALRVARFIRRFGESFTSGGQARRGLVAPLHPNRARAYLPLALVEAAAPPILRAYVAFDEPIERGASVEYHGTSYQVAWAQPVRVADATLARFLVLVREAGGGGGGGGGSGGAGGAGELSGTPPPGSNG